MDQYDIIVLGTGPAGEGAAMMGAKSGKRVAVVERYVEVGGGCTHWGTIPSKALRQAVKTLYDARREPMLKSLRSGLQIDFPTLLASANSVIETQVASRRRFYDRNQVPVYAGMGSFVDPHVIEVRPEHGVPVRIRGEHIVVATGSRPYHPPELDFGHPRVCDSDSVLRYAASPFAVTIYGAGVIGCEYASIFLTLGCKVTLVNTQDRLLSFLDDEITEALSYHLHEQGCVIRHGEQFAGLEPREQDVVLLLKSGRRIKSDLLLWANGRTGNTDGLNLAAAGLEANSRGQIAANGHYQTATPHIYAAGDVVGPPALASAGYVQGCHAVQHILDNSVQPIRMDLVPSGIYTLPEISSVGLTGQMIGMLKILFHTETLQVLGVHCFGDGAAEIIHIGQTVMASRDLNNLRYFTTATFNYPTMAEAYRVAAYNGLNRLT